MIDKVKLIITKDFSEIYKTELSLVLLDIYSKLYLHGSQPKWCEASQREYYKKICKTGLIKAKKMTQEKTFELKKNKGIKYVGKPICRHFNLATLTEEDVLFLYKHQILKKSDFKKLPAQLKKKNKTKDSE